MNEHPQRLRASELEESGEIGINDADNPTMGEIIGARFHRRDFLRGSLAVAAISAVIGSRALEAAPAAAEGDVTSFDFKELEAGIDTNHHVAEGYETQILLRWGDPIFPDSPEFDPLAQSAEKQRRQFGYNSDFIGFFPIDNSATHGLLVANHEYTNEELMFAGVGRQDTKENPFAKMTKDLVDIEIAAHGGAVVELIRSGPQWSVVKDSKFNRRITADTEMQLTGPAAGHERMKTSADATGARVLGMINNCAGGVTPWGTWLSAEENIHGYFIGALPEGHRETANYKRLDLGKPAYAWGKFHDRFDVSKEPNEPNRFGWIVEIDPFDPDFVPKKRTALGRFKHEGAAGIINKDGRYVIYQGDDERFDYVYKFVTERTVDTANAKANLDILDTGTLFVAKYNADGSGEWMPIVFGQGSLTETNGFKSQADVLIETRRAADLLGATRMDRPEDIETSAHTNRVYVMLTNNDKRKAEHADAANPRADNKFGHIIEMLPEGDDHAATKFKWEVLVRCGDPSIAEVGATFSSETTKNGWFGMPDNCVIDSKGRLWVATDGNNAKMTGRADGLWALETQGEKRGTSKHFFRVPAGAEMCGPFFTADDENLFLAVQHPGEFDDDKNSATFENPLTRWPDFKDSMPPRPSVIVVTKKGGGAIA
ncbi:dTDP-glucose 4,6-dehydratase [Terrihabitans soli]|uniref:dTDP-glucose 4,6-dehydratase n=1 Tax=Terrihabitans soli TaxID=708113 RepID=A0A6S6QHQ8_9HYPH|nr:PhoX family phosphatase [Terrihabitans soli]BCJ90723.1 dTDP-glucose 4,6-dehydratase [Terrihabitans soli]